MVDELALSEARQVLREACSEWVISIERRKKAETMLEYAKLDEIEAYKEKEEAENILWNLKKEK